MLMKTFLSTLIAGAAILASSSSAIALSEEARCLNSQLREAGRYGFCRMKTQAKSVRRGDLPTGAEVLRCADKFTPRWDRILNKLSLGCPTLVSSSTMEAQITACIDDLSSQFAGLPDPLPESSRCLGRQLKDGGKFVSCRLKALGALIKKTDNAGVFGLARSAPTPQPRLDAATCDEKLDRLWTRTAQKQDDCTNALLATQALVLAEVCIDEVAVAVAAQPAPTTTTLLPLACGDGGPCSMFVRDDPQFCDAFGGIAGADAACQAAGEQMLPRPYDRRFIAWMSDATTDVRDRLTPGVGPYESTCSGKPTVAVDQADLLDGTIGSPLVCNSAGSGVVPFDENRQVWTGTLEDGTFSGLDCDGWSDRNTEPATTGTAISTGEFQSGKWTEGGSGSAFPALFHCIEVAAP
ncbi:MAG: hypothetical protein ACI8TX_000093 [Hyphomicrobiaceae bacterium]|jgi:hypothetical protein